MKTLKSLDDFNHERRQALQKDNELRPNGIACPKCNAELLDIPGQVLLSNPPKIPITCNACGYRGSRVR